MKVLRDSRFRAGRVAVAAVLLAGGISACGSSSSNSQAKGSSGSSTSSTAGSSSGTGSSGSSSGTTTPSTSSSSSGSGTTGTTGANTGSGSSTTTSTSTGSSGTTGGSGSGSTTPSTSTSTISPSSLGKGFNPGDKSTTTLAPPTTPPTTAPANPAIKSVLNDYNTYNTDFTNLDYAFQSKYLIAMRKVATKRLVDVALYAAFTTEKADDRDQGKLVADQEVVKVSGSKASLTSCLDEKDWYLVNTVTGKPDKYVARGDFVGIATAVEQDGKWYLNSWSSLSKKCNF